MIAIAQEVMCGLILVEGFLFGLRTGRILPGLLFCWAMLTVQAFLLSSVGAKLAVGQDSLCLAFPEGPEFVAFGLLGGWVAGFLAGGSGKLIHILRKKSSKQSEPNQASDAISEPAQSAGPDAAHP